MWLQRITYETKKPTHDVRIIAEVEGGVIKAGKELDWKERIIIPPLPQSSLTSCGLIKIEYYVKVRYTLIYNEEMFCHVIIFCLIYTLTLHGKIRSG